MRHLICQWRELLDAIRLSYFASDNFTSKNSIQIVSKSCDRSHQTSRCSEAEKTKVEEIIQSSNDQGQITLQEIIELFDGNDSTISIIGNSKLNTKVQALAEEMYPAIKATNEKLSSHLKTMLL
ncbi:hypothetical protein VTP01DRAFT_10849 [Rhizomucor pusillus]|uniref:uncharacterized protein n=1 Tax=Rhizomucor pusillus TaxID=4840 RepID=UPI0037449FF0